MPDLLPALDAFVQEHRRCGELSVGVGPGHVWMACDCDPSPLRPIQVEESRPVDDVRTEWKRLKAAGVEFVEDPTDYGNLRIATLKDPEGNLVQLLEPLKM